MADSGSSLVTIVALLVWLGSMFVKPLLKALSEKKATALPARSPAVREPMYARDQVLGVHREALDALASEKARLSQAARRHSGPTQVLEQVLGRLDEEHAELRREVAALPALVPLAAAQKLERVLAWQHFRLAAVSAMTASRADPRSAEMMADADAIAAALLRPFAEFCESQSIAFPQQRPVCVPAAPGHEAIWFGLLPDGYPAVFVPEDFGADLLRWPALAHELGHLIFNRVPRLAAELRQRAGVPQRSTLFDPNQHQDFRAPYAAWLEELFSDFVATLQLGPSAVRGLLHVFGGPIKRGEASRESATVIELESHERYAEHPPAALRVALALHLLGAMNFEHEAQRLAAEWEKLVGRQTRYLLPAVWGQRFALPAEALEAFGKALIDDLPTAQLHSLAQFPLVAIPGFEMGPGLWAEAKRDATSLLDGEIPHDDARLLIAAGIEARAQKPSHQEKLARSISRAIIGIGEPRRPAEAALTESSDRTAPGATLLREALILREVLRPRQRGMLRRVPGRL